MSTSQKQQCYDRLILQRLLSEQLSGNEELAVLAHIESCQTCRDAMANIAGEGELGCEIEQHLADLNFDDTGQATLLETDGVEADIGQIRALLGPTDDPHMLGRLGCYEVSGIIGRGSTGVVFKALDRGLNRFVAIKMLMPSYAGNGPARKRFEREGRSIASVRDEHVVQVFAVDEHQGIPFIVMEYLPTGSLANRIEKEGTMNTSDVVRIGMQIAQALAAAHKQGIVHRDVKPANVLLANGVDRALVTDFGLARILDESSMTRSGSISGTPQFMSPEQAQGDTVDHRSDLFSLGSVLYAACTGHSPFRSETVFGVIKRVCETEPRPIKETNSNIKQWLGDFITKLHSKNPADRFQSAQEVCDLLAVELAYAQSPAIVPKPDRKWRRESAVSAPSSVLATLTRTAVVIVLLGIGVWIGPGLLSTGNTTEQPKQDPVVPARPLATRAFDDGDGEPATQIAYAEDHSDGARDFETAVELFDSGKFTDSIASFKIAARSPQFEALSQYNIGCAFAYLGKKNDAVVALDKAVSAGFRDRNYFAHDSDLDVLRDDSLFKELMAKLEKLSNVDQMLAKAERLEQRKRYPEAEAVFRSVLELDSCCDHAAMNLGLVLHLQGKLEEAYPWHQQTARSECYSGYGNYNLACYYSLKGETDKAFEYWAKAINAGYTEIRHFKTDQDLDALRKDERFKQMIELAEQQLQRSWSQAEIDCKQLLNAIRNADLQQLKRLLKNTNANSSCPDYTAEKRSVTPPRLTPLGFAAANGNLEAVEMLISAGASATAVAGSELTPLMQACQTGSLSVAKHLVANGAEIDRNLDGRGTALTAAAMGNQIEVMDYLIANGAKLDAKVAGRGTALIVAAEQGCTECVQYACEKNANVQAEVDGVGSALSVAVQNGEADLAKYLLDQGANINASIPGVGCPLSIAIREQQRLMFDMLIKLGAEVDNRTDGVGSPLTVAAYENDVKSINALILERATIDLPTNGVGTALSVAVREGNMEAVKLLLKEGANTNTAADGTGTPLMYAVKNNDLTMAKVLLDAGAQPDLKSPGKPSAMELAHREHNAMIELLTKSVH